MSDLDLDGDVYRAADDLPGVRQRAVLARKIGLVGNIGPITAERFARDLEELAAEVERLRGVEAALRDALKGVWHHVEHKAAGDE